MNEFPIQITIDEDRYWEGLGRQEMDFNQVLGELIDNSISASGYDEQGDLNPFTIEITIERIGNRIKVNVADQGIGMSIDDITKSVFSPGGKGHHQGPLNEHGFGLKNALCVLSIGNKFIWRIMTRDEEIVNKGKIYLVNGPFSSNMKVEITDKQKWNKGLKYATGKSGTRIYSETTFSFFNTLYRRARTFETVTERLIEHLGVMYKKFLEIPHNKMFLRWRNLGDDENNPQIETDWEEERIKNINIFYDSRGSRSSEIEVDGPEGKTNAIYIRGNLDENKVKDISLGKPYPLAIYYQGNIRTQGVDIVIRDRTIKTGQLPEIWSIDRHNSHNRFVGELLLGKKFRTVNNKTSLDPHNPYWINLQEKLQHDEYQPQKVTGARIESDIQKWIKTNLEGTHSKSNVHLNRPIWGGGGVKVDVYHEITKGRVVIYEIKSGTASPIDAYQLLMYWDGVVKDDKKSPKIGRLVAKEIPDNVRNIIKDINKRKDSLNNKYKLEYKTIKELGVDIESIIHKI